MDPFDYDQRFARFARLLGSDALSRGTRLFEAEAVRVVTVGKREIKGLVESKPEGVHEVKLVVDDETGMSGNCTCPEFFNCCHSYALARAARVRIVAGRESPTKRKEVSKVAALDPELDRLWKRAKRSGFILYPKDLYSFVADRSALPVQRDEPLRDLKRALAKSNPDSVQRFGELLRAYFDHKGIKAEDKFKSTTSTPDAESVSLFAQDNRAAVPHWQRSPVRFRCRVVLEATSERDWFQARAVWEGEGGAFDDKEWELLRKGKGGMVQLPGKGWFRVDSQISDSVAESLATLGLDPDRGNQQRIHLVQIADIAPDSDADAEFSKTIRQRVAALKKEGDAIPPSAVEALLRPYQVEGFAYLCRLSQMGLGGVLADDMGLGKTLQTLAWMQWLQSRCGGGLRVLIVCPKSVMGNWLQEPGKFELDLQVHRFQSDTAELSRNGLWVANYTQLRLRQELFLEADWDVVVLDEAQYIKSPDSQTSKVAHRLKGRHRLALTGTPIENSLTDLWSIMRFVMPRLFGPLPSFKANYGSRNEAETLGRLRKRVAPFLLRRLKSQVAKDLPDRIEEDLYCELEGEQKLRYDETLEQVRSLLRSSGSSNTPRQGNPINVLQALLRLRQICCDHRLLEKGTLTEGNSSAKLQAMCDLVEPLVAEGHKVLVFSQFVQLLELARASMEELGIKPLMLTGKTKKREDLVRRFQEDGSESVFLLSLKAAGSGITLSAASYVILLDPWWNPAVEAQAIDRAHRIGQKNKVIAYRILAKDTIEEKIRALQKEKSELASALFEEGVGSQAMDWGEIEALLSSL